MRIITGIARGIKLDAPQNDDATRPTTEMAKEGIFSSIQFDIAEARVLDLFAGSGQLGLEALSRGASLAVFVDSNAAAFDTIKKNAQRTGLYQKCRILRSEYGEYLKAASREATSDGSRFDFIFADPPYREGLTGEIVKRVLAGDLIKAGGKIFCETDCDAPELSSLSPEQRERLESVKTYKYGKSYFHVYEIKRVMPE